MVAPVPLPPRLRRVPAHAGMVIAIVAAGAIATGTITTIGTTTITTGITTT